MRLLLFLFLVYAVISRASNEDIRVLITNLNDVLNFIDEHYYEINFDGLLGVVIAESQLLQILKLFPFRILNNLIKKCEIIRSKILPRLSNLPSKYTTCTSDKTKYLTDDFNSLEDMGFYDQWTTKTLLEDKFAVYKGIPTDVCISEILNMCQVSPLCFEMMLEKRIDTGYLLTHRLLYLQVARIKGCHINQQQLQKYSRGFCSLMLKEARTNKILGFPQHDILLEQILFCGLEGYEEFLTSEFRSLVIKWKSPYGCYYPDYVNILKRTANRIDFGCTDHATGLGAAALALNLRYKLQTIFDNK